MVYEDAPLPVPGAGLVPPRVRRRHYTHGADLVGNLPDSRRSRASTHHPGPRRLRCRGGGSAVSRMSPPATPSMAWWHSRATGAPGARRRAGRRPGPRPRSLEHAPLRRGPPLGAHRLAGAVRPRRPGGQAEVLIHGATRGRGRPSPPNSPAGGGPRQRTASARHHDLPAWPGRRDGDRLPDGPVRRSAPRRRRRAGYGRRGRRGDDRRPPSRRGCSCPSRLPSSAGRAWARGIYFIVERAGPSLSRSARLIDMAVRPVLDVVLPLARAREAFERGLAGHVRGRSSSESTIPRRSKAGHAIALS